MQNPQERNGRDDAPAGVRNEIRIISQLVYRVEQRMDELDELKELLAALDAVGRAGTRMVQLIKAERVFAQETWDVALRKRLLAAQEELRKPKPG
jgi:hypothetical protein